MDAARSASVAFVQAPPTARTLVVTTTGSGAVTSSPAGIATSATMPSDTAVFQDSTAVTLTAAPDSGWHVASWGGACQGAGTAASCVVTMDSDQTVSVAFVQLQQTLTASITGSGALASTPTGISISGDGASDSASFAHGTAVTLSATPASGWTVGSWGGACAAAGSPSGTAATCQVTLTADSSASVTFVPITHTLKVSKKGKGDVSSFPSGIACGSDCDETYSHGARVILIAIPRSGQQFDGWSGDCSGTGFCVVTMDQDRDVRANFSKSGSPAPLPASRPEPRP